jgi:(1->4)-alpha-D-glucan 1-alpha-D-glucosylmutase
MTTLSTHDTKRGEDVRARLSALAQVPGDWETAVRRWQLRAAKHGPPDDHVAYFFWQTLVGTWPLDTERVTRYLNKAIHEAKRVTTWREPNAQYDDAVERFAAGVMADDELLADVERFVGSLERPARAISLTQKLLQATMPGVPDTYQGAESVNRRLVDPDNRGPVDFARLRESLTTLADDKQRVTAIALRLRRDHPHWFSEYRPMSARGAAADHAVAFARSAQCIVVAARFTARLEREGGWRDTTLALPEGDWIDALSGVEHAPGDVPLAELLRDLPGALLVPAVTLEEEVA